MPPAGPSGPGRGARVVVPVLGILLVVHSVLVALWLAPTSPLRDSVGSDRLASYVDPYFAQGDDTLGIGSNRVDEAFQVRAFIRDTVDGEPRTTEWIDVTALERRALRRDLDPARTHQAGRRLATTVNFAVYQLTAEQRATLADIAADDPMGAVGTLLRESGASARDVENLQAADEMARRFAALWMGAELEGTEILQVGYRVGRRQVPELSDDSSDSLKGRSFTWVDMGWRRPFRATPQARESFTDYVRGFDG